jgi:hypothetical protein
MEKMNQRLLLTSVSALLLGLLAPSGLLSQDEWGVGFRFGDPSGITVKKYQAGKAFELSIGRTRLLSGEDWYDDRFGDWYRGRGFDYRDYDYLGHEGAVPIGIQFHYLIQQPISGSNGLDWYYGFGGQLRLQGYRYDYRYRRDRDWVYVTSDRIFDFDLGVDAVIGMEYRFPNSPLSLFLDLTLFMEVLDDPFLFWPQGGIGGRFNF